MSDSRSMCANSTEPPRIPVIKVIPACYQHRVTGLISTCYLSLSELHEAVELCGSGTLQRRSWRHGNKAQMGCTSTREGALLSRAVLLPGPSLLPLTIACRRWCLGWCFLLARKDIVQLEVETWKFICFPQQNPWGLNWWCWDKGFCL